MQSPTGYRDGRPDRRPGQSPWQPRMNRRTVCTETASGFNDPLPNLVDSMPCERGPCAAVPSIVDSAQARLSHRAVEIRRFRRRARGNHGVPPLRSTNAFHRTQNESTSGNAVRRASCADMTSANVGSGSRRSSRARTIAVSASTLPRSVARSNASLVSQAPGASAGQVAAFAQRGFRGLPLEIQVEPSVPAPDQTTPRRRPSPAASVSSRQAAGLRRPTTCHRGCEASRVSYAASADAGGSPPRRTA